MFVGGGRGKNRTATKRVADWLLLRREGEEVQSESPLHIGAAPTFRRLLLQNESAGDFGKDTAIVAVLEITVTCRLVAKPTGMMETLIKSLMPTGSGIKCCK
ncbi:hypothetical protein chiPu_0011368 [Chiloscyllium punctatum]|uniref:Uncharacterized protein n=1 Tax=Chiloscyllium punctatum TaxID=137246 RepID=A0A401SR77_CHIPU|nr:hypothetical protein [Chiloscyllium punctatum]